MLLQININAFLVLSTGVQFIIKYNSSMKVKCGKDELLVDVVIPKINHFFITQQCHDWTRAIIEYVSFHPNPDINVKFFA